MSPKVLVAYATKTDAIAGIAAAVAAEVTRAGCTVDVHEASDVKAVREYDAVVLGSPIYLRRRQPDTVRFLRTHQRQLRERPVWFLQSGSDEDQDAAMPASVTRPARAIGAAPAKTFAGDLQAEVADSFLARQLSLTGLAGDVRNWDPARAWAGSGAATLPDSGRVVAETDR